MSATKRHEGVVSYAPQIEFQARRHRIKLPMIERKGQDAGLRIDQFCLLEGLAQLHAVPKNIIIRPGSRIEPNPKIRIIDQDRFDLVYLDLSHNALTSPAFSQAFWLGCLTIESLNSTEQMKAYKPKTKLAQRLIEHFEGLGNDGPYAREQYLYNRDEYFLNKNSRRAKLMANDLPVLSYDNQVNPVTNLDDYRSTPPNNTTEPPNSPNGAEIVNLFQ